MNLFTEFSTGFIRGFQKEIQNSKDSNGAFVAKAIIFIARILVFAAAIKILFFT